MPEGNTNIFEAEQIVRDAFEFRSNLQSQYEGIKSDICMFGGVGSFTVAVGVGLANIPETQLGFVSNGLGYLYEALGVGALTLVPVLGIKAVLARRKLNN